MNLAQEHTLYGKEGFQKEPGQLSPVECREKLAA